MNRRHFLCIVAAVPLFALLGCGGDVDVDEMKNEIKKGIEEQSGVAIKEVSLIKESERKYTGLAESMMGEKVSVEVVVDPKSGEFVWKVTE